MKNVKLGRQLLDHVVAHPEEFNMHTFGVRMHPCRTVACLAGHTLLFSGWTLDRCGHFCDPDHNHLQTADISAVAAGLLGLTIQEYRGQGYKHYLFSGMQTDSAAIERFRVIVEKSEAAEAVAE